MTGTPTGPCVRCGTPCPRNADGRRQLCPDCDVIVDAMIAAWQRDGTAGQG